MIYFEERLIPRPKHMKNYGQEVKIAGIGNALFWINVQEDDARMAEGAKIICDKVNDFVAVNDQMNSDKAYEIIIKVDREDTKFLEIGKEDAYYIEAGERQAVLCGYDAGGAFYAAVTFADMLEKRGSDVFAPVAQIIDYPDFKCRGHFFECRYGSEFMTKKEWFEVIDYMSGMKLNQMGIGIYGCWSLQYDGRRAEYLYIPLKKYPQLKTPKNIKYYSVKERKWIHKDNLLPAMFEEDFLGELIAYGKKRNIRISPRFNSLGHNTLIPTNFPEISAKKENGEPSGFGFCTENEKTYEILFDIYDEIITRYLEPNGITSIFIGLDEVSGNYRCQCEKCKKKEFQERMIEHAIKLCKYLKAKGMKRIHLCYDMFCSDFNILNEELKVRFVEEGIYDEVLFEWWTYEDPNNLFWGKEERVNNLFHSIIKPFTGYFNWSVPTEHNENIRACAKVAARHDFEGMEAYGSYDLCYDKNYLTLADVSWNYSEVDKVQEFEERYAYRNYPDNAANAENAFKALSDIMMDDARIEYMNRACHYLDYYYYSYERPGLTYPQNFPTTAFERIRDSEGAYPAYLEFLKEKSGIAIRFFENSGNATGMNNVWLLTAKHYFTLADEYQTLYQLHQTYNKGVADEFEVMRELDRLLMQRESLMCFAEIVKFRANSYIYLRNMSVFRQLLCDLREYFKKETSAGRKAKFDLYDWSAVLGAEFDFLR
ncbi:MAG: family 20 glycosylhydrolase [Lachnospiraceae bacterium]|nr:family 20 glycosylhydrolase [Lachnospiraceae bacterium]